MMMATRPCSPPLNHQSLQEMKAKNKLSQQQFHLACENEARNHEINDENAFHLRYTTLLKSKENPSDVKYIRKVHYTKGGPQDVIRIRLKKLRHSKLELNRRRATSKNTGSDPDNHVGGDDLSDKDDAAEQHEDVMENDIDQNLEYDSTVSADDDVHEMECELESMDY